MTPIEKHLADLIEQQGPLSIASFMSIVLGHPEHGYYSAQRPFGADGDFVTAPEVSQIFGELIGLWCAQAWLDAGRPSPFNLVELGPGRGVLMADALRAMRQAVPDCIASANVHLVETSRSLRREQETRLDAATQWHDQFADIPKSPTFLIANEFFDALPIHQYSRSVEGWRERCVAYRQGQGGPEFTIVDGPVISEPATSWGVCAEPGDIVEVSPSGMATATQIAEAITAEGGAALIIDYGYFDRVPGDTLQAVRDHRFHPVLSEIGTADLTAHVSFRDVAAAALTAGARVWGPITQGDFLERLGIQQRCDGLSAGKTPEVMASLQNGVDRLVAQDEMGTLFKVLAITDTREWCPAGFGSADRYDYGGGSFGA